MKDIKCPLCKEKLDQFNVLRDGTLVEVGCHKCKWSTHPNSPEEAWKEVEEFISLFPPIMRLKPGDPIKIRKLPDNFFVIKTDVEKGVIRARSTYGYSMSYVPEDVEQWPWELEQKGGNE